MGIFLTITVVPCQSENTTVTLFFFFCQFSEKNLKQTAADQTMLVLSVQIKLGEVIRLTL